jgi:ATP-dependent Lon protease
MVSTRKQNLKKYQEVSSDSDYSTENSLSDISDDISDYSSDSDDNSNKKSIRRSLRNTVNKNKITKKKVIKKKNNIKQSASKLPPKKTLSKKRKYKDDSDASDIDLEDCTSNEEDEEDIYKNFIDEVVENMVDDTCNNIQNRKKTLRNKKWRKGLNNRDISKYEKEYNSICDVITVLPEIQEVLKINMPFKSKCDLAEKIIILDNVAPDTFDHLNLKKSIRCEIDKYKNSQLVKSIYSKYADIEKKLESTNNTDLPLKYKILGSEMSFENKVCVYKKYKYYVNLCENSSEQPKLLNWINAAIGLPTKINKLQISISDNNAKISKYLYDVRYKLNRDIYGMDKAKEQILCLLNNKITNPNVIGSAMALQGPQGVGKTKIIQVLSDAIDIPFDGIALGGAADGSFLKGHGFTYEGSRPGCIVDSITKMKSLSGIIFFDEIDKISKTKNGEEISKTLLEITDFTQNHKFTDKYLGNDIKINLSNMWFIYSLNYASLIDKTLIDRIPIINIGGYDNKQKKEMALKYLIPEALNNINLKPDDIIFSNGSMDYIIQETNKMYSKATQDKNGNSGVRKLKDAIASIIMKLNLLRNTVLDDGSYGELNLSFSIKDFKLPFTVLKEHVDTLNVLNKSTRNDPPPGMYT